MAIVCFQIGVEKMEIMIFGAKSIALGLYTAMQTLYPQYQIKGFLVTSSENNPLRLAGLPVIEVAAYSNSLTQEQIENTHVLVGTPEDIHPEIIRVIEKCGFTSYTCMTSVKETTLMEAYYEKLGVFSSLHTLEKGNDVPKIHVFMIKSHKDHPLEKACDFPGWVQPIQVGAALAEKRVAEVTDDTGENISIKNGNYCELTALYWLWKNRLGNVYNTIEYYGLYHYRRVLDISQEDLKRLKANNVDVVLQFPTLHEPDIREHHSRYVAEQDWEAMLQALSELRPEYAKAYEDIFSQQFFYNYNMIIATKEVLADYCTWLFPVLERTEELSNPKGWERKDRYIGYLGESLLTLYFMYNRDRFNIYHTGRIMLT